MTAPFGRSAIVPTHGIAPFHYGQAAVVTDPSKMFFRSLWAYDNAQTTIQSVLDSMHRLGTLESALTSGDSPIPTPPPLATTNLQHLYADILRESALSARFTILPDVFAASEPDDPRDPPTPEQLAHLAYDETFFFGVFAPIPGILVPSDFQKVNLAGDALLPPLGKYCHFNFSAVFLSDGSDDVNAVGGWVGKATPNGAILSLEYNSGMTFPAIFLNDGTDGTAPVPLALGRTLDEQAAYLADPKNAAGVYFGFPMTFTGALVDNPVDILSASVGHSIGMAI